MFAKQTDKHKHNRANRNTFISQTIVNSIIAIIFKLMKEEILNSVREAGIYSVQIDSTQDVLQPTNVQLFYALLGKTSKHDFLPLLTVIWQHERTCAIC